MKQILIKVSHVHKQYTQAQARLHTGARAHAYIHTWFLPRMRASSTFSGQSKYSTISQSYPTYARQGSTRIDCASVCCVQQCNCTRRMQVLWD